VKDLGIGVLLVEQNAKQSLAIADRGYLLENTRVTHEDTAARLANDPAVQRAYLGAGSKTSARPSTHSTPLVEVTKSTKPTGNPTPRRSADQQIGGSIDDLVAVATKTSAEAPRGSAPETMAAARQLASSKIEVVLKDIEQAAMNARQRAPRQPRESTPSKALPEQASAPPPIIEVYKRPRVEVYRRRPSGQFERD
jgi:branched-chain amino acid transport system ATP-binding protein